jgi:NADH:ubiquinone oxidoreductase subunit 6 (subunit J)
MVLYVFVIAYVGGEGEAIGARLRGAGPTGAALRRAGAILAGALAVELLIALLGTGLKAIDTLGAGYTPGPQAYGTPAYIGELLLTRFLLAFEVASFLLLIAAVGGVVLAGRSAMAAGEGEGGEDDRASAEEAAAPLGVPPLTGSMLEGVGR